MPMTYLFKQLHSAWNSLTLRQLEDSHSSWGQGGGGHRDLEKRDGKCAVGGRRRCGKKDSKGGGE